MVTSWLPKGYFPVVCYSLATESSKTYKICSNHNLPESLGKTNLQSQWKKGQYYIKQCLLDTPHTVMVNKEYYYREYTAIWNG